MHNIYNLCGYAFVYYYSGNINIISFFYNLRISNHIFSAHPHKRTARIVLNHKRDTGDSEKIFLFVNNCTVYAGVEKKMIKINFVFELPR